MRVVVPTWTQLLSESCVVQTAILGRQSAGGSSWYPKLESRLFLDHDDMETFHVSTY